MSRLLGVVYRTISTWREEKGFRCGRAHFDLDSLDSCAVSPDDPGRATPNPPENRSGHRQDREEGLADAGA